MYLSLHCIIKFCAFGGLYFLMNQSKSAWPYFFTTNSKTMMSCSLLVPEAKFKPQASLHFLALSRTTSSVSLFDFNFEVVAKKA